MKNITANEMKILLVLFKDISTSYNANSISKVVGITPMGALKILKKMEKENLVVSKKLGHASFYKPNMDDQYPGMCIRFLLQKEAEESQPAIKRWANELKEFAKFAKIGILFGSVTQDPHSAKDIDILLVFEKSQMKKIQELIQEKNKINIKKIHVIKQTEKDLKENIKRKDKVLLSILKRGIVVFGHEELIEVIKDAAY
ncbi:MAG: nucleotidyltransferase domain-containing protein [Nanoarchaeota archaeon]|nr:nucleotidyltransferase domain-containing protein [Nanoarchaeota archaeon]